MFHVAIQSVAKADYMHSKKLKSACVCVLMRFCGNVRISRFFLNFVVDTMELHEQ